MLNKLTALLEEEREIIDKYKMELVNLPKGNIYIREKNGQVYVEVIDGNKKQGISKQPEQIYGLARKEYVGFLLKRQKAYCKVLKNMVAQISKIDDEIDKSRVFKKLNKLSGRGIDLQKIYWTDAEYEWARAEFEYIKYNFM